MNDYAVEVHNLAYSFNDRLLFNNVSFKVKENTITSIVGANNSGKTTLIKILGAFYPTENMIKVGKVILDSNNLSLYKKKVVLIDFLNFKFNTDNVYSEVLSVLDFTGWSFEKKDRMVKRVLLELGLTEFSLRHPSRLSKRNKLNLVLAKALVFVPKIVVMELNDVNLTSEDKDYIFEVLKKYVDKDTSVIFSTNNSEDILYSNRMIVLHKGNIAVEGATNVVLKKDSLLLKLGVELPFMVDLSLKLKFYEIVDKTYLKEEDLVNKLWK